ncbi:MAG: hypothetical protein ACJ04O_04460 [Cellvibrionales bacterium]
MTDKTPPAGCFKNALSKLDTLIAEDMSDYDEDADYDTRVKLPEWQLAALKKCEKTINDLINKLRQRINY